MDALHFSASIHTMFSLLLDKGVFMTEYLAKKNNDGKCLLLQTHLNDTGFVMEHLLANYCSESTIHATGMNREEFESIARFIAFVHDIGKSTPAFQKKILGESLLFQHALAGAAILYNYFNISKSICDIVAAHHGKPRSTAGLPHHPTGFTEAAHPHVGKGPTKETPRHDQPP